MKKKLIAPVLSALLMLHCGTLSAQEKASEEELVEQPSIEAQREPIEQRQVPVQGEANVSENAHLVGETTEQSEQQPYSIGIFRVLDMSGAVSIKTQDLMLKRLRDELHVPLNGVLNKVKVSDWQETLAAFQKLPGEVREANDRNIWLKGISEKLGCDLVLVLVIDTFYERTRRNWDGDLSIDATAQLSLCGWDRREGKPVKITRQRWDRNELGGGFGVEPLAFECLELILREAKLRERFYPEKIKEPTDKAVALEK